ncbi:MAG TPA: hypothetical protein P5528_14280, partial [Steroidobacteraceae bacterium]|nr:hypothetical protein [Steroidobacteraceae bacterium]
ICALVVLGLITFAAAAAMHKQPATSLALGAVTLILVAGIALNIAYSNSSRNRWLPAIAGIFVAYVATILVGANELMRALTPWYDLPKVAAEIHADVADTPCGLLQPDETTIAMLDYRLRTRCQILRGPTTASAELASRWFEVQGARARLVVRLPGRAPGEVSALLAELGLRQRAPRDGLAADLVAQQIARIERRYAMPHGRRYALLAPAATHEGLTLAAEARNFAWSRR